MPKKTTSKPAPKTQAATPVVSTPKKKKEPPTYWTAQPGDIIETETYTANGEELRRDVVAVDYKSLHKGDFYMTVSRTPGHFTFSSAIKQTENGHDKDHSQIVFTYRPHVEKVKAPAKAKTAS